MFLLPGRILNRFAKDQSLVDEVLPNLFFDFVQVRVFFFFFCYLNIVLFLLP